MIEPALVTECVHACVKEDAVDVNRRISMAAQIYPGITVFGCSVQRRRLGSVWLYVSDVRDLLSFIDPTCFGAEITHKRTI